MFIERCRCFIVNRTKKDNKNKISAKHPRGYQRVHTIACYADTWNKFNTWKRANKFTGDQSLNHLVDYYKKEHHSAKKEVWREVRDAAEKELEKLD